MKIKHIYTAAICLFLMSFSLSAQLKAYKPELLSPINSSENLMPITVLDWEPVSGFYNIRYQVQISENNNFSGEVLEFECIESAIETPAIHFGKTYYWRVRAIDDNNTSEWSDIWQYNTFSTLVITAPGTSKQSPRPTLKWEAQEKIAFKGIGKFEVVFDNTEDFDPNSSAFRQFFVENENGANFDEEKFANTIVDSLYYGQSYYWKVRAYNYGEGNLSNISDWSEVSSFEVVECNEQNKPKMAGGKNLNIDPTETLSLKNSYSPSKYIFQVDLNEDFSNPIEYVSTTINQKLDTLKFGEKYYWRAAMKYGNSVSEWTEEVWWFTIISAPELAVPENGTELINKSELRFKRIGGVNEYTIQVSSSPDFTEETTVENIIPQPNSGVTIPILVQKFILTEYDITYYWRVKANNDKHGETEWSEVRNFIYKSGDGIEDLSSETSLYPNPNNGQFYLSVDENINNADINIIDLTGRTIYNEKASLYKGTTKEINANLNKGVYIIQVISNDKKINKKFTVM